jgi:hypothetical protein
LFPTTNSHIENISQSQKQFFLPQIFPQHPHIFFYPKVFLTLIVKVRGKVSWVVVNPGSQTVRIGSFHPITEGDWTEAAYINAVSAKLFNAVNKNDTKTVKECIEAGVDVNERDSTGRTPLLVATFSNAVDCARLLLESGAKVAPKLSDGRNALHVASSYGFDSIVVLLLAKGRELQEAKVGARFCSFLKFLGRGRGGRRR